MDITDNGTPADNNIRSAEQFFVNEECGDTLWEEVLKQAEARLRKAVNKTPDDNKAALQPEISK